MSETRQGIRIPSASVGDINQILATMSGDIFYCSASLYHNVDVSRGQYQAVYDIQKYNTTANTLMLLGDYGRIFNQTCELRWQYRQNAYDVLLLTNNESVANLPQSHMIIGQWTQSAPQTYITKHGTISAIRCQSTISGHTQFVCYCSYQSK